MHCSDQVAIVTGGASGIGRSICRYLGRMGARVIVAAGGHAQASCVDVTESDGVASLIGDTVRDYGRIAPLPNNAGISVNGEFRDILLEKWRQIVDVNLWGVVYGCFPRCPPRFGSCGTS